MPPIDFAAASKKRVYLAFMCMCVVMTTLSGQPQLLWRLWRIAHDQMTATGVVTRLECLNHGHVDYSFRVESTPIEGRQHFVDGISCKELRTGQRIAVIYERATPENNYALTMLADSGNRAMTAFWTGFAFVSASAFLGPMFLVLVWTVFSKAAARINKSLRIDLPGGR
jgi:hypothetical protein